MAGEGREGGGEEAGEVPSMIPEAERYASWLILIVSFERFQFKGKHFMKQFSTFTVETEQFRID